MLPPGRQSGYAGIPSTHGIARRSRVPNLPGTKPKLCPKCDAWFAAAPRARVCDGCRPFYRRSVNAAKAQVANGNQAPKVMTRGTQVNEVYPQVAGGLIDGFEPRFHPDARVAAFVLDFMAEYPRTWKNILPLVKWERVFSGFHGRR